MRSVQRLILPCLAAAALFELLRYDLLVVIGGFPLVRKRLPPARAGLRGKQDWTAVCEAVNWGVALYWKPVLCLQRAVVTVRLLRRRGVAAEVVIGCRPEPFLSHAWVEWNGQVLNDSPAYRQQLSELTRF